MTTGSQVGISFAERGKYLCGSIKNIIKNKKQAKLKIGNI
jgi:hypothetical protein